MSDPGEQPTLDYRAPDPARRTRPFWTPFVAASVASFLLTDWAVSLMRAGRPNDGVFAIVELVGVLLVSSVIAILHAAFPRTPAVFAPRFAVLGGLLGPPSVVLLYGLAALV